MAVSIQGVVAHMVERSLSMREVGGSIPSDSNNNTTLVAHSPQQHPKFWAWHDAMHTQGGQEGDTSTTPLSARHQWRHPVAHLCLAMTVADGDGDGPVVAMHETHVTDAVRALATLGANSPATRHTGQPQVVRHARYADGCVGGPRWFMSCTGCGWWEPIRFELSQAELS